jgi:transposase
MAAGTEKGCGRCTKLEKELQELKVRLTQLEGELAKARKNSTNSSKPPSSDICKKKGSQKKDSSESGKRKRGAQFGHPRHERKAFNESEIDLYFDYCFSDCPNCGDRLELSEQIQRTLQQVELTVRPIQITEHRVLQGFCTRCQKMHTAPIPEDICRAGLVGPRLTALVGYLKGACHCSFSTIRKFLRDVVGITISRGQLRKLCDKVSQSLEECYQQLLEALPGESILNVDETGHRDNGQRMWTWCFRASLFTLFKIDPSRSSSVLIEVLGKEFNGVLGCDYFSAYRKYMGDFNVLVQFCLAHFIRDVKFLVNHPDERNQAYGREVLDAARQLFGVIHRREELSEEEFTAKLRQAGDFLTGRVIWDFPETSEAQNLARRFQNHGVSYLQFITTPGVEPTNNLAEQAIRFVVIDRHVTQGSRSEAGQRWLERIWTAMATCTQQGRSVFEFLHESVAAFFQGQPSPSLLLDTS